MRAKLTAAPATHRSSECSLPVCRKLSCQDYRPANRGQRGDIKASSNGTQRNRGGFNPRPIAMRFASMYSIPNRSSTHEGKLSPCSRMTFSRAAINSLTCSGARSSYLYPYKARHASRNCGLSVRVANVSAPPSMMSQGSASKSLSDSPRPHDFADVRVIVDRLDLFDFGKQRRIGSNLRPCARGSAMRQRNAIAMTPSFPTLPVASLHCAIRFPLTRLMRDDHTRRNLSSTLQDVCYQLPLRLRSQPTPEHYPNVTSKGKTARRVLAMRPLSRWRFFVLIVWLDGIFTRLPSSRGHTGGASAWA